jgi:hypothetical protein
VKLTIFGLTVTSSWGNGHATLWRGLIAGWCCTKIGRTFVRKRREILLTLMWRLLHHIALMALRPGEWSASGVPV